jgi:hypothetical protein
MVRVAIGSAIHHFSLFHSRPVAIDSRRLRTTAMVLLAARPLWLAAAWLLPA